MMQQTTLVSLLVKIGELLVSKQAKLVTAESCTGGGVAYFITRIDGSSRWFDRGYVTYSNQSKIEMLNVSASTLSTFGAVSEEVVREMAEGALAKSEANFSLAITGIAGPTGGSKEKPVGTCWFGWSSHFFTTQTRQKLFTGDREEIRSQAISFALDELLSLIKRAPLNANLR